MKGKVADALSAHCDLLVRVLRPRHVAADHASGTGVQAACQFEKARSADSALLRSGGSGETLALSLCPFSVAQLTFGRQVAAAFDRSVPT